MAQCSTTISALRWSIPARSACTSGKSIPQRNHRKRTPRWPSVRERLRRAASRLANCDLPRSRTWDRPSETLEPAQDLQPGSPTQSAPFRRIAVCVDGSEMGETVVLHAADGRRSVRGTADHSPRPRDRIERGHNSARPARLGRSTAGGASASGSAGLAGTATATSTSRPSSFRGAPRSRSVAGPCSTART